MKIRFLLRTSNRFPMSFNLRVNWRADFVKTASARLEASENLNADIALANLAATLPCDSIRSAFARAGNSNGQTKHPRSKIHGYSLPVRHPGLMVVLKELPCVTRPERPGRCQSRCENKRNGQS